MSKEKKFFKTIDRHNHIEVTYSNGCFSRNRYCDGEKMSNGEKIIAYEAAIILGVRENELIKKVEG